MFTIEKEQIINLLENTKKEALSEERVFSILQKGKKQALKPKNLHAEYIQGLNQEEVATLLHVNSKDKKLMNMLFQTAFEIKKSIYGNRMVIFAPLYLSNYCQGGCLYCGFRSDNKSMDRKILGKKEILHEVEAIQKQGHKRLLLLTGDHPLYPLDEFIKAVEFISSITSPPHGDIRRINVEIPSLTSDQFKKLKATGKIGTYALFQETYHLPTYQRMHPYGPKSDYHRRLSTMDRALQSGMDDVGIGVLFGLYDYKFEVMSLISHSEYLDNEYNVGAHTISVPRIQPAENTSHSSLNLSLVSDDDFKKIVAILRIAVPYTGIILSTRENSLMRRELYHLGVSQISAGSKTEVGGYSCSNSKSKAQFVINDHRSLEEVVQELIQLSFIPSFCTACYRLGRTGKEFMNIAKTGDIQKCCQPNALLTLAEYLVDYASRPTREMGWNLIEKLSNEQNPKLLSALQRIKNGERDVFF